MVTQLEIARRVGLDVSSVNKILNERTGAVFRKDTIRQVFKTARELGFRFDRLKHPHVRRHARKAASIPARITLLLADGSVYDQGNAVIRELSPSGAMLADVTLAKGRMPLDPFSVTITYTSKAGPGDVVLQGTLIRLKVAKESAHWGIAFVPDRL